MAQRPATPHLTGLQKSVLRGLDAELRRRRPAVEVPYADIVRALSADKASVTTCLRQLQRQGLVRITLPRGSWTRCVGLTDEGQACVRALERAEPRPVSRGYIDDRDPSGWDGGRWWNAVRRRDRKRERRSWRRDRRSRPWDE